MKAARPLFVFLLALTLIGTAAAEPCRSTLSFRAGMASAIQPHNPSDFPTGLVMLAAARSVSDRWSLLASAGYLHNTRPEQLVSIPEIRLTRLDRSESLVPLALGFRFEAFRHESDRLGVQIEAAPALYWYRYDFLAKGYDMNHPGSILQVDWEHRFLPGLQLGVVAPGRLTSVVGWELGVFYHYAQGFEREDGLSFRGMNHVSLTGGLSVRL